MLNILQASLIAFSTTERVQAFEFYDKLNKVRVLTVSEIILGQKTKLENVQATMTNVKAKVQENEKILGEYQEMWEYLGNDWKQKLLDMKEAATGQKMKLPTELKDKTKAGKKGTAQKGVKFRK